MAKGVLYEVSLLEVMAEHAVPDCEMNEKKGTSGSTDEHAFTMQAARSYLR